MKKFIATLTFVALIVLAWAPVILACGEGGGP